MAVLAGSLGLQQNSQVRTLPLTRRGVATKCSIVWQNPTVRSPPEGGYLPGTVFNSPQSLNPPQTLPTHSAARLGGGGREVEEKRIACRAAEAMVGISSAPLREAGRPEACGRPLMCLAPTAFQPIFAFDAQRKLSVCASRACGGPFREGPWAASRPHRISFHSLLRRRPGSDVERALCGRVHLNWNGGAFTGTGGAKIYGQFPIPSAGYGDPRLDRHPPPPEGCEGLTRTTQMNQGLVLARGQGSTASRVGLRG